jgi:hypothetical protein
VDEAAWHHDPVDRRQKQQRRYVPDFLVEYEDGRKAVIEVKDPSRLDSGEVQRKRKSAEMWCKQRHMEYG